ncbi:Uncharacterised protein [Vibrio cholerae]|nr:Uncharacterised protein [Vibrio cholerae]
MFVRWVEQLFLNAMTGFLLRFYAIIMARG